MRGQGRAGIARALRRHGRQSWRGRPGRTAVDGPGAFTYLQLAAVRVRAVSAGLFVQMALGITRQGPTAGPALCIRARGCSKQRQDHHGGGQLGAPAARPAGPHLPGLTGRGGPALPRSIVKRAPLLDRWRRGLAHDRLKNLAECSVAVSASLMEFRSAQPARLELFSRAPALSEGIFLFGYNNCGKTERHTGSSCRCCTAWWFSTGLVVEWF